jgi:RNA polymerase sigma-70 factor (ECF subfamily)
MSAYLLTLPAPRDAFDAQRQSDDEELRLIRRVQSGDELAFAELVDRHEKRVFAVIRSILPRSNDAEDIAQQTFAKAWFGLADFEFRGSIASWLYRIAVNECFDYLRKKRTRPLVSECDLREEEVARINRSGRAPASGADVVAAERDLVVRLLARMSPEDRSLLLMRELEGYTLQELAKLSGLNANTVKVRLFRSRHRLMRAARQHFGYRR